MTNPHRLRLAKAKPIQAFAALPDEQPQPLHWLPVTVVKPFYAACPWCDARTLVNGGGDFTCQGCGRRFHVN